MNISPKYQSAGIHEGWLGVFAGAYVCILQGITQLVEIYRERSPYVLYGAPTLVTLVCPALTVPFSFSPVSTVVVVLRLSRWILCAMPYRAICQLPSYVSQGAPSETALFYENLIDLTTSWLGASHCRVMTRRDEATRWILIVFQLSWRLDFEDARTFLYLTR